MNRYCRYILILLTLSFTMSDNSQINVTADNKCVTVTSTQE